MQQVSTGATRPSAWAFDVPWTLGLAFWAAILEMVLGRGLGSFLSYFAPRGAGSAVVAAVQAAGMFVGYFSTLLCVVLAGYVIVQLILARDLLAWWRKISVGVVALPALGSVAALLLLPAFDDGFPPERIVGLVVMTQGTITALALLLGIAVLTLRTGWIKRIFAVLPVLVLLLVLAHQFFYFYPLTRPAWIPSKLPEILLVAGHLVAILFPFAVAIHIGWQHVKHRLPVFIHVLVAIAGFFPCLMLANMPNPLYEDLFFAMMGMLPVLPFPGIVYPVTILPLLFVLSALVGTPVASWEFLRSRRRAGFGLALVFLGAFTPLTAPQAAFLLLGTILWMKSIVLE